jgi:hypothetical protein
MRAHTRARTKARRDRQVLALPQPLLASLPAGPITLSVTVTNVFGVSSASHLTFKKSEAVEVPLFELDRAVGAFIPSQGFRLAALQLAPAPCPVTQVWCVHVTVAVRAAWRLGVAAPHHTLPPLLLCTPPPPVKKKTPKPPHRAAHTPPPPPPA